MKLGETSSIEKIVLYQSRVKSNSDAIDVITELIILIQSNILFSKRKHNKLTTTITRIYNHDNVGTVGY